PRFNEIHYGPRGLNLVGLTMALAASIWNSLRPSRPQSGGTHYGPRGLSRIGLDVALAAS
ncbi:hypothetical protein HAX54_035754, partial [Datura stramonium]|nr:hypothetical protein [Datura stramonium]